MKKLLRHLVWLALIAALCVGGYVYSSRQPIEVEMAKVERGPVEQYITEEAKTRLHTTRLVTSLSQGVAQRIELEEGDTVRAGQVVTTIEDLELQAFVRRAQAQLDEIQAHLDGADVTLPKQSQVDAAARRAEAAAEEAALAENARRIAETNLALAEKNAARISSLCEKGSVPVDERDRAERDRDVARLELTAAELRMRAAAAARDAAVLDRQVLLDSMKDTEYLHKAYGAQADQIRAEMDVIRREAEKTKAVSPIDGVVLEKFVDMTGYVAAGAQLLLVGDPASIEVESDILSDEIRRVEIGQRVVLTGGALGRDARVEGRLKKIYPTGFTKVSALGVRQQRVKVLVEFDTSSLALAPGYELDVHIVTDSRDDAVLVPAAAVFATPDGTGVFRVRDGVAALVGVKIGIRGDDHFEVLEGLQQGDTVILRPPRDLADGGRVAPAP